MHPRGWGNTCLTPKAQFYFVLLCFTEGVFCFSAFCVGNGLFREVVVEKIDFLNIFCRFLAIFADFWPFLTIFTFFGAFSLDTV